MVRTLRALGSPDIICVLNGQYVGIEVKVPKEKLRDQVEFQKNLEAGRRKVYFGV